MGSIGLRPTKFNFPSPHFYTLPSLSPRPEGEATYLTRNIGKRFRGTWVACAAFGSFIQNLPASRLCPFSSPLLGKLLRQVGPSQVLQPHFIANEYFHFWLLCLSSKWFTPLKKPEQWVVGSFFRNSHGTQDTPTRYFPLGRSVPRNISSEKMTRICLVSNLCPKTSQN